MSFTPPDFNQNSESNGLQGNDTDPIDSASYEAEPLPLSPAEQERVQDTKQRLQRIFIILVGVGAGVGLIIAIALVLVLTRFGLVGDPQESVPPQDSSQQVLHIHHVIADQHS